MSKRRIWLSVPMSVQDLAVAIASENEYEAVLELIRQIDVAQQDWEFTQRLRDLAEELMADEDADKVNDR